MNPTAKGTLWAVCAAVSLSWLPLFFLYTHTGNDPFVWRSWLILFQSGVLGLALVVMPAKDKDWRAKIRRFLFYWGDGGEPVRVRNPLEVLKTPAFWMVIGFAVDLTFWVWAATLIDPLVATLVFQLFPLGMVWMAARLGRKISAGRRTAPHVIAGKHWALMASSFLGAALVVWSETGTVRTLNWLGIALALAATAFGIGSFWGTVSTGRLMTWPDDDPNDLVWAASLSAVVGRFFALPLTLLGSVLLLSLHRRPLRPHLDDLRFSEPDRSVQHGRGGQPPLLAVCDIQVERPADHVLLPAPSDVVALDFCRCLHRQAPGPPDRHRHRAPLQPGLPDQVRLIPAASASLRVP